MKHRRQLSKLVNIKRYSIDIFLSLLLCIILAGVLTSCGMQTAGKDVASIQSTGNEMTSLQGVGGDTSSVQMPSNVVMPSQNDETSVIGNYSESEENNAISVVRKNLEANKSNDYDAWKSTYWAASEWYARSTGGHFTPGVKPGDLAIVSLDIKKIDVSYVETKRIIKNFSGSDYAKSYGWTDEFISHNMIAVYVNYEVVYNSENSSAVSGDKKWYYYLIRENKNYPWYIWDKSGNVSNYDGSR